MKAQKRVLYEWRNPSVEKRHLQKAKAEQEEMIVTQTNGVAIRWSRLGYVNPLAIIAGFLTVVLVKRFPGSCGT